MCYVIFESFFWFPFILMTASWFDILGCFALRTLSSFLFLSKKISIDSRWDLCNYVKGSKRSYKGRATSSLSIARVIGAGDLSPY